jgi:Lar family restriction alleviation protein
VSDKLLPCPYCNSTNLTFFSWGVSWRQEVEHAVFCLDCGVVIPSEYYDEDAAKSWNTRTKVEEAQS